MTEQDAPARIHVVVGAPWKDAVIEFLEPPPRSSAFPELHDARPSDGLVVVFDCEPRIVLTQVGRIEATGGIGLAMKLMAFRQPTNETVVVSRVGAGLDAISGRYALFEGSAAAGLARALDIRSLDVDIAEIFGGSSAVAARLLLGAERRCSGCDRELDLTDADARDAVEIRTVDALEFRPAAEVSAPLTRRDKDDLELFFERLQPPSVPVDWPAVLCPQCRTSMSDKGFDSFLDYKFSRHPACPRCGGRQTQRALFGMPVFDVIVPPWREGRGCCVTEDNWTCTLCMHRW